MWVSEKNTITFEGYGDQVDKSNFLLRKIIKKADDDESVIDFYGE